MIELPLIFVSGLLGSSHCIGMCGPFAAIIGGTASDWRSNLAWQLIYSGGRIFTYTVLGMAAAVAGQRLAHLQRYAINVPALLAFAAGSFLVYEGLVASGALSRMGRLQGEGACLGGTLLRTFLTDRTRTGIFLAGLFTGFLPCGLVYAFLLTAAGTRHMLWGAATMLAFGFGTVPIMVATGCSASMISLRIRQRMFVLAGWCVVVAGLISIYRGYCFLGLAEPDPSACPLCR